MSDFATMEDHFRTFQYVRFVIFRRLQAEAFRGCRGTFVRPVGHCGAVKSGKRSKPQFFVRSSSFRRVMRTMVCPYGRQTGAAREEVSRSGGSMDGCAVPDALLKEELRTKSLPHASH